MFIVKDLTGEIPFRHHTNDSETAADIVLGMTGEQNDYNNALTVMSTMNFGDVFISKSRGGTYSIECVTDEEAEEMCKYDQT